MSEQAIGATSRLLGAVGAATSLRKVTAAVPGHGQIIDRQDKGPLVLSPHRRDGRHVRVVRVLLRHNRDGRQGKGAHVFVPRPRAMQATGGPVGDHPVAIEVVNRRFSHNTRRSSDAGARVRPISHRRLLLLCRRFAPDVVPVASKGATLTHRPGCHVCGQLGCHTVFHGPAAVSPQAPPAARCFVCGQRGCYPFRHRPGDQPPVPSAPNRAVD